MQSPDNSMKKHESISAKCQEAFVAATVIAFQELCGTEVTAKVGSPAAVNPRLEVAATMILRHDPPGELSLSFPLPVLEILTRRYFGDESQLTAELLDDAAGEFLNVIAGQAKTMLKETPAHYLLSIPSVHRSGEGPEDAIQSGSVEWRFDCDCGSFVLRAYLPR